MQGRNTYSVCCGNGLQKEERLALARHPCSRSFRLHATSDVGDGEIIGEYLGKLTMVNTSPHHLRRDPGYLVVLQDMLSKTESRCVTIDDTGMAASYDF